MERLIGFIQEDLKRRGEGDFTGVPYEIVWNTDTAINQSETIENLVKSAGMLSRETLLAQHPFVGDVKREMARMRKEEEGDADVRDAHRDDAQAGDSRQDAGGGGQEAGADDDAANRGHERGGADRALA